MSKMVNVCDDGIEKCIKAIGESLIKKAKDISNDIDKVTSITIYANISGNDTITFDVTKNYAAELEEGQNDRNRTITNGKR